MAADAPVMCIGKYPPASMPGSVDSGASPPGMPDVAMQLITIALYLLAYPQ